MARQTSEERLRREAAAWFARSRGPNADQLRPELHRWLEGDPRRRAVYERLGQRWDEAAILATRPSSLVQMSPRRRARSQLWVGGAVAAVALIALAAPVWTGLANRRSLQVSSAIGQLRTIKLSDGSRVILDADSAVTAAYSPKMRKLRLERGRARFMVATAPTPFVVTAETATVSAHGTVFDVDLEPGGQVNVVLLKGVVDVQSRSAVSLLLNGGNRSRLSGEQSATLRRGHWSTGASETDHGRDWTSGFLNFSGTPLIEVVTQVNRYSRDKIHLEQRSLDDLRVSAVLRPLSTPDFATSLAVGFGLDLRRSLDGDLVLSARGAA